MDTFIDSIVDSKPRRVRKSRVLRCTNCGRENGRQRTYCTRCGTVLRKTQKVAAGKPAAGTRTSLGNEAMLIAVLLLLVAVVYLVYSSRQAAPNSPPQRVLTPREAPPPSPREAPPLSPSRAGEPAVGPSDAAPKSTDSAPVLRHYDSANLFSDGAPAAPRPARKAPASGAARAVNPLPDTPAIERPAPPPADVKVAPPAAVTEAPRPTTQQLLHGAIEQCAGDFLSRFVCEQKARVRYCEGQWGRWPECPGMPTLERGTGG